MARVLLLGSTGYFGRGIAHAIIDQGHQLRVLVRDQMKAAAFKVRGAQVMIGDALEARYVMAAADGVEHIVSLVAVRRNHPQSYLAVNVDGARLLADAAKAVSAKSVLMVSDIGAKLDPHFKYLTSRWMGEQELAKSGVPWKVIRFSYVLAEEGGIVDTFQRSLFGPAALIPGSGQAQIQPIVREDATRCVVEAINRDDLLGKVVELGGPEVVTFEAMFDWFLQARGLKNYKVRLPVPLLIPVTTVLETVMQNPPITPDEVHTIQLPNLANGIDSVSSNFGWRATRPSEWAATHWARPGPR